MEARATSLRIWPGFCKRLILLERKPLFLAEGKVEDNDALFILGMLGRPQGETFHGVRGYPIKKCPLQGGERRQNIPQRMDVFRTESANCRSLGFLGNLAVGNDEIRRAVRQEDRASDSIHDECWTDRPGLIARFSGESRPRPASHSQLGPNVSHHSDTDSGFLTIWFFRKYSVW